MLVRFLGNLASFGSRASVVRGSIVAFIVAHQAAINGSQRGGSHAKGKQEGGPNREVIGANKEGWSVVEGEITHGKTPGPKEEKAPNLLDKLVLEDREDDGKKATQGTQDDAKDRTATDFFISRITELLPKARGIGHGNQGSSSKVHPMGVEGRRAISHDKRREDVDEHLHSDDEGQPRAKEEVSIDDHVELVNGKIAVWVEDVGETGAPEDQDNQNLKMGKIRVRRR